MLCVSWPEMAREWDTEGACDDMRQRESEQWAHHHHLVTGRLLVRWMTHLQNNQTPVTKRWCNRYTLVDNFNDSKQQSLRIIFQKGASGHVNSSMAVFFCHHVILYRLSLYYLYYIYVCFSLAGCVTLSLQMCGYLMLYFGWFKCVLLPRSCKVVLP